MTLPVIIAGASFAGLAAARELRERAVLVDPEDVGEGQTSACGAPVSLLVALGAGAAVQQVHEDLVIHTPARQVRWPLPEPFCTFDYRTCCREAAAGAGSGLLRAAVRGRRGTVALTSQGPLPGSILIDCTGWRRALVGDSPEPGGGPRPYRLDRRYFGLETEARGTFFPGLHFYFWPEIVRDGYAWAFPAGPAVRIGVLSYRGRTDLGQGLRVLLGTLGMSAGPVHGGFLGTGLHPPVIDGVFCAGDAAGQCLPFTGEGIRSAVWAGLTCGRLIRRVLDGRLGVDDAAGRYEAFVRRQRRRYRALVWATLAAVMLPARVLGSLAAWAGRPGPLAAFMHHYLDLFVPDGSDLITSGGSEG
jgi:menaquinone-9 beta-reductase